MTTSGSVSTRHDKSLCENLQLIFEIDNKMEECDFIVEIQSEFSRCIVTCSNTKIEADKRSVMIRLLMADSMAVPEETQGSSHVGEI